MDPLSPQAPIRIRLATEQWEQMHLHVRSHAAEEVCGLIAGKISPEGEAITNAVLEIPNQYHSPVKFRMDPHAQLEAFLMIEQAGLDLVAIYHSHPSGPDYPSPTDIAESYYPEALALIWSPKAGRWDCRAYRLQEGQSLEVDLQIT